MHLRNSKVNLQAAGDGHDCVYQLHLEMKKWTSAVSTFIIITIFGVPELDEPDNSSASAKSACYDENDDEDDNDDYDDDDGFLSLEVSPEGCPMEE